MNGNSKLLMQHTLVNFNALHEFLQQINQMYYNNSLGVLPAAYNPPNKTSPYSRYMLTSMPVKDEDIKKIDAKLTEILDIVTLIENSHLEQINKVKDTDPNVNGSLSTVPSSTMMSPMEAVYNTGTNSNSFVQNSVPPVPHITDIKNVKTFPQMVQTYIPVDMLKNHIYIDAVSEFSEADALERLRANMTAAAYKKIINANVLVVKKFVCSKDVQGKYVMVAPFVEFKC